MSRLLPRAADRMPLDPKLRWGIVLLVVGLYVAAFPLVYPVVGKATGALPDDPSLGAGMTLQEPAESSPSVLALQSSGV